MVETHIRESFRQRRAGGGLLVFIGLPLTLFWARFGLPPRGVSADLFFFLAGPGVLLMGLWAAFPRRTPRIVLTLSDDAIRVRTVQGDMPIQLEDLIRVTKTRPLSARFDRLTFETSDSKTVLDVIQLTHEANDIIKLISIRLEKMGKYLREGRTEIMGAPSGVWDVHTGNPFEEGT